MDEPGGNPCPARRNPSPGVHLSAGHTTLVLLTVTTAGRQPWLASDTVHQLLHQVWFSARAWLVGDYLLMPDHLHAFCAPADPSFALETWIRYWKREFRCKHGRSDWGFQSRGWHHRLRAQENYSVKWRDVQENPVRRGLVEQSADWPFKGRVFDLTWSGNNGG